MESSTPTEPEDRAPSNLSKPELGVVASPNDSVRIYWDNGRLVSHVDDGRSVPEELGSSTSGRGPGPIPGATRQREELPRPRWAPDPWNPSMQRYWDGAVWTGHVAPANFVPQGSYPPTTLGGLAAVAGILGFLGSLVPLFGGLFGFPAPVAVWAGVRCLSIGRHTPDDVSRSARALAWIGICFGVLGTVVWLFWCVIFSYELLNARDPFRGL